MAYGMAMASRSHHFNCGAKLRSAVVHGVAYPQATAERQRLIDPFGCLFHGNPNRKWMRTEGTPMTQESFILRHLLCGHPKKNVC